jgi:hypothetical protein
MNAEMRCKFFWRFKADFASIQSYNDMIQNKGSKIKWVKAKSPKISPIFKSIFAA